MIKIHKIIKNDRGIYCSEDGTIEFLLDGPIENFPTITLEEFKNIYKDEYHEYEIKQEISKCK